MNPCEYNCYRNIAAMIHISNNKNPATQLAIMIQLSLITYQDIISWEAYYNLSLFNVLLVP